VNSLKYHVGIKEFGVSCENAQDKDDLSLSDNQVSKVDLENGY